MYLVAKPANQHINKLQSTKRSKMSQCSKTTGQIAKHPITKYVEPTKGSEIAICNNIRKGICISGHLRLAYVTHKKFDSINIAKYLNAAKPQVGSQNTISIKMVLPTKSIEILEHQHYEPMSTI